MGRRTNLEELEDYLVEAIDNIRADRETTKRLLQDAMGYLGQNEERHKEVGLIAAKYVETLQRSNEQLVKITALMNKGSKDSGHLSERDKDAIFDMIQNSPDSKEE
tara:strand:- start:300 stop:617 length:318 start_codon:yes stop_codon:yes gene_type:complete